MTETIRRSRLRAISCCACALLLALGTCARAAEPAGVRKVIPVDRIVAVVNDEVITDFDLRDQVKQVSTSLAKQGTPLPPRNVLERQVLERMINTRVQLQFAKESGVRIEDAQLERTLTRIAEDNKLTVAQMRDAIERDGMSFARFRDEVRDEIIIARLREREVDSRIVITDAEIDSFLQHAQSQGGKSEEYNLAHILVRVPEQASPDRIRDRQARAEAALAQLKSGVDFGQVSASYSDAAEALQGGVLGWREDNRLPTLFLDALKNMRVGEVSGVLRSPNGFHILKLVDKRGSQGPVMVRTTHVRHILIKTSELVSESEAKNRLLGLRERILNGADFAELARLHSQDGSSARGGDLGWISPGDTVPAFERAMDALKPNELSQPVGTEFGWHLIQVLERRDEDRSKERNRLAARQALRERKSDEAYQEWLRQLRDRAFVQVRLEDK